MFSNRGSQLTVRTALWVVLGLPAAINATASLASETPQTLPSPAAELELKKVELRDARLEARRKRKLEKLQREIAGADVTVLLDAKNGWQSKNRIQPEEGDRITIRIINTSRECYTFNLVEVGKVETEANAQGLTDAELNHTEVVDFSTIHVESTAAYEITMTRRNDYTDKECPYARMWRLGVVPTGWELGFAGSYVVNRLTNPAFALRPGTGTNAGTNEIVIEDKEDHWNTGAAAMVHLYHSGGFDLGKGVSWAPLSFGLGIVSNDDAEYYFGTGLKFGKQAFLTAGVAIGSRDELGPGLRVGDFTPQANLSLESRTDSALFVGISFSFLNANISQRLQEPFRVDTPKPQEPEAKPGDPEMKEGQTLSEGSATKQSLNELLEKDKSAYRLISVGTRVPETGPEITELTVRFVRKDETPGTEEDSGKIKKLLETHFPGTTFNVEASLTLREELATKQSLNTFLTAVVSAYEISSVGTRVPETGPEITELTVQFVRKDGTPGTEEDSGKIKKLLETHFPTAKFNVAPSVDDANNDPQ